jgi:hypothetical protein
VPLFSNTPSLVPSKLERFKNTKIFSFQEKQQWIENFKTIENY